MIPTSRRSLSVSECPLGLVWAFALATGLWGMQTHLDGARPKPLPADEFERLHALIKPHPGEARWMEIDWYPSVWEGRVKAAADGKPIILMAGSGGAPCAGC